MKIIAVAVGLLALGVAGAAQAVPYSLTIIDVPNAAGTTATAINDSAMVAGTYSDGSTNRGYTYKNGTATPFPTPGDLNVAVNGINNSGVVVGTAGGAGVQGFTYANGVYTPIIANGSLFTFATDIN